jgi:hypothetical protein
MNTKLRGPQATSSICLVTLLILACAAAGIADQKKNAASHGASVFAKDGGKLTIKLDGQTVGHEEFEITPSASGWLAKGSAEIKPSQAPASKVTGSLTLQPDRAPVSYQWTSHAEKTNSASILFCWRDREMTLQMQGASPFRPDLHFRHTARRRPR